MRYEHPPIVSLLIGAVQEADLVSPGFEQLRAISNRSTLDFTLHCGEQTINQSIKAHRHKSRANRRRVKKKARPSGNGSSFLATHRGNGYALRACHLMMMMMMMIVTVGLSRTVSEINGDFYRKSQISPTRLLNAPLREFVLEFCNVGTAQKIPRIMPLSDRRKRETISPFV